MTLLQGFALRLGVVLATLALAAVSGGLGRLALAVGLLVLSGILADLLLTRRG